MGQCSRLSLYSCSLLTIGLIVWAGFYMVGEYQLMNHYEYDYEKIDKSAQTELYCGEICSKLEHEVDKNCCSWGQIPYCMQKKVCKANYLQTLKANKGKCQMSFNFVLGAAILYLISYFICLIKVIKKNWRDNQQEQRRREIAINRLRNIVNFINQRYRGQQYVEQQVGNRNRSLLTQSFLAEEGEETCAICYENFENKKVIKLKCGHIFHSGCIVLWIEKNPTCPCCRFHQ